ncbi:MAG TPA: dihydrofolate reductase family protein [Candidatus Limnocylindria bacterium]|nr:dihydrofolate reductase family protein [Candidatus Limnocylindria bacterium]
MPVEPFRVDRLWPDPAVDLSIDVAFADLHMPAAAGDRPSVGVNMVTSVDGRAQLGGGADGLGSRVDRRLMRLLRAGFDAVATGSGTLRATGFWPQLPEDLAARRTAHGQAPQPVSVVIAGSQPVPLERWRGDEVPRILIVGSENPQRPAPNIELLRAPTPDPEPRWLLEQLRQRGIGSVLLEGGPTTNAAFLAADCIDELFWTVGPMLVGTDALPMIAPIAGGSPWAEAPRGGRLVSVHRNGDELFVRYRFG